MLIKRGDYAGGFGTHFSEIETPADLDHSKVIDRDPTLRMLPGAENIAVIPRIVGKCRQIVIEAYKRFEDVASFRMQWCMLKSPKFA